MSIQELSTEQEVEMITCVIDGFEVTVPKGTLVIRAAEKLGIQIPRFCDHPLLEPAGACRQCLVDIEINGRAFPKPQASCTIPVENGMIVKLRPIEKGKYINNVFGASLILSGGSGFGAEISAEFELSGKSTSFEKNIILSKIDDEWQGDKII